MTAYTEQDLLNLSSGADAVLFVTFERDWYDDAGNVETRGAIAIPLTYDHKYERWELMDGRLLDRPSHDGYELIISDALSEQEQETLLQTDLAQQSECLHDSPVVPNHEITEPRIFYVDLDKIYYERHNAEHGITVDDCLERWYVVKGDGPVPAFIHG